MVFGQPGVAFRLGAFFVASFEMKLGTTSDQVSELILPRGKDADDLPKLFGDERFDFALALDDESHGDALDTARTEPTGDFAP